MTMAKSDILAKIHWHLERLWKIKDETSNEKINNTNIQIFVFIEPTMFVAFY